MAMNQSQEAAAKTLALSFYRDVIGDLNEAMIDSLIAEDYIQHNPMVKTGRAGFMEAFAYLKQMPRPENPKSPIVRTIAEGNLVALHLQVEIAGSQQVVLDLFRVEDGKLAEHWDVMQMHPRETSNGRGMTDGVVAIEDLDKTAPNKALVQQFYQSIWLDGNWAQLADFVHEAVMQHHHGLADGLPALATAQHGPTQIDTVHRLVAEGNFVVAQLEGTIDGTPHAIYEIHRLADGLIVEQWTVQQAIPDQMAHGNGMF
ncbi:MAG: nuclear transport factor 2 family protein [Bacteroidota bacterium]